MNLLTEEDVLNTRKLYKRLDKICDILLLLGGITMLIALAVIIVLFIVFLNNTDFTMVELFTVTFIIVYIAVIFFCVRDLIVGVKLIDTEYKLKHNRNVAIIKQYESSHPDKKDKIKQLKNYSRECGTLTANRKLSLCIGVSLTILFTTLMFVTWLASPGYLTPIYVLGPVPLIIGIIVIAYSKTTVKSKISENANRILKYKEESKKE